MFGENSADHDMPRYNTDTRSWPLFLLLFDCSPATPRPRSFRVYGGILDSDNNDSYSSHFYLCLPHAHHFV
jgi:hypothetical protein